MVSSGGGQLLDGNGGLEGIFFEVELAPIGFGGIFLLAVPGILGTRVVLREHFSGPRFFRNALILIREVHVIVEFPFVVPVGVNDQSYFAGGDLGLM